MTDTSTPPNTYSVDPARLNFGRWCHHTEKQLGEGDIPASYSAERIAMGEPVRKPFSWKGSLWVCVCFGRGSAEVYRLTLLENFHGAPVSYRERVLMGDAARKDPDGFYHSITVSHGGKTFVLTGPEVELVAGEPQQMELFAGLL